MRRVLRLLGIGVAILAGIGFATAIGYAATQTTGTNVSCATATLDGHTVGVDGNVVDSISGASSSNCVTQTYTIPTSTETDTVTNTQTATTTVTVTPTTTSSTSSGPPPVQPVGDPQGKTWTLAFDDEFNGSSIDTSKWDVFGLNQHNNNGVESDPADCSESNGNLVLDTNNTTIAGTLTGCNISSAWQPYTGQATGANAWELAVGDYVEARVWMPSSTANVNDPVANWPAWWTAGASWPQNGELDMTEGLAKNTCSYHTNGGSGTTDHPVSPVCTPTPIANWAGAWHTYGVYRGVSGAVFYWDGVDVNCVGSHATTCSDPLPMTDGGGPQALRFNIGQHASYPGNVQGPAGDMLVDWVRGYTP